jgi:hypothetical protein
MLPYRFGLAAKSTRVPIVGGSMDPIALAAVTSAVTTLAMEAAKSTAGEAGKSLWEKIKKRLGFASDPKPEELPVQIAIKLNGDEKLASEIIKLLQGQRGSTPAALVGRIDAEKVVIINQPEVKRDLIVNV